jgi:hypothetical protein
MSLRFSWLLEFQKKEQWKRGRLVLVSTTWIRFTGTPLRSIAPCIECHTMEMHSCLHCNMIVIDLPYPENCVVTVQSMLSIDVETVKSAVQVGCVFFQWALNVDSGDFAATNQELSLGGLIANLPSVVASDAASDDEDTCIQPERVLGETGDDSNNTTEEVKTTPQSRSDTLLQVSPRHLRLHFETCGKWPRRCLLQRDMTQSNATRPRPRPRPRPSIY